MGGNITELRTNATRSPQIQFLGNKQLKSAQKRRTTQASWLNLVMIALEHLFQNFTDSKQVAVIDYSSLECRKREGNDGRRKCCLVGY